MHLSTDVSFFHKTVGKLRLILPSGFQGANAKGIYKDALEHHRFPT